MCEKYEAICKSEFAQLHAKLDRLDVAMRGNGKLGIVMRIDRLEQSRHWIGKAVWFGLGIAASVLVVYIRSKIGS